MQFAFTSSSETITTESVSILIKKGVAPVNAINIEDENVVDDILSYIALLQETFEEKAGKVDKVDTITDKNQAYIKNANGLQEMIDVSEDGAGDIVSRQADGNIYAGEPKGNNDATPKHYVDNLIQETANAGFSKQEINEKLDDYCTKDFLDDKLNTDYVQNTEYATESKAGVVRTYNSGAYGLYTDENDGHILVIKATDGEIFARQSVYKPIVPASIDIATFETLVNNEKAPQEVKDLWAVEENKAKARELLGIDTSLRQEIEQLYAITKDTVYTKTETEDAYSSRQTAGGLNLIDGTNAILKKVQGNSFRSKNLINHEDVVLTGRGTNITIFTTTQPFTGVFSYQANNIVSHNNTSAALFRFTDKDNIVSYLTPGNSVASKVVYDCINIEIVNWSSSTMTVSNMQLEEGTNPTPYVPYFDGLKNSKFKSLTSTGTINGQEIESKIELDEPIELATGDYIDFENKIIHKDNVDTPININNVYKAYKNGLEIVENENDVYGAQPTLTQEYFTKVGV